MRLPPPSGAAGRCWATPNGAAPGGAAAFANTLISWSGLDIGRDRGSPVSHYAAPFEFTGKLLRVTVVMHDDQKLDGEGVGKAEMARQ